MLPGYRGKWPPPVYHHRPSNSDRLRIWLNGVPHDFHLGPHNSDFAAEKLQRILTEIEATGQLPRSDRVVLADLIVRYLEYAKGYYQPTQYHRIDTALKQVVSLYGSVTPEDFGPRALKTVLSGFERKYARTYCNHLLGVIKRAFRWMVGEELLAEECVRRLNHVGGLRKRHTVAREPRKILPVDPTVVEKTIPLLTAPVRGLVRLQLLTGCRPGEACLLRPCDLTRPWKSVDGVEMWLYTLDDHKTDYHGCIRTIPIGPKAQALLLPLLDREAEAYCFSPREGREAWEAQKRERRRSKVQPSQLHRRKQKPRKIPGNHYTHGSYRQAVARACERGGIEPWHPNQIRHLVATLVETSHDRDHSRCVLGHTSPQTTAVYAEWVEKAAVVLARMG